MPLTTPEGNHFPFSLHGHCLASAGGPGKLFMYGGRESIAANAIHGSDSNENAAIEGSFYFSERELA